MRSSFREQSGRDYRKGVLSTSSTCATSRLCAPDAVSSMPITISLVDDAQVIIMIGAETHLVIRQPYLEGMLPYEYTIILKALKQLSVKNISIFFEASAVSNGSLNGHVHRISHYYNKRFYKYTETGRDYHAEITLPSD